MSKQSGKQGSQSLLISAVGFVALLFSGLSIAALEDDIRERLQPTAQVCVFGDECAAGMTMAGADTGPKDPEQVYQTYCFACHGTGVNNAPVLGNAEHWSERMDKGINALYDSAINGFNNAAMPAKGLCMDCSNEDLQATVDYMLESL